MVEGSVIFDCQNKTEIQQKQLGLSLKYLKSRPLLDIRQTFVRKPFNACNWRKVFALEPSPVQPLDHSILGNFPP
jgi:hypothetical protein